VCCVLCLSLLSVCFFAGFGGLATYCVVLFSQQRSSQRATELRKLVASVGVLAHFCGSFMWHCLTHRTLVTESIVC